MEGGKWRQLYLKRIKTNRTSGQDGGIGRYTLPPCTTKRSTTNIKTKNNQNCQKIELYGSPTTKELKKKHSFRLVGGVERTCSKAAVGRPGVPHLCADKLGGTTGEQDRPQNAEFRGREIKPQNL